MKRIFLLAAICLQTYMLQAQCNDWNWPEDKATAEEKNVLYTDAVRNDNFAAAQKPHLWLLQNAPKLNTSIYINGEKIYKGLIDATDDETRKAALVDSLMLIYDMRIENCGEEAEVTARKAYQFYVYNIRQKDKLKEVLEHFDKAYDLNGTSIPYYMHVPYMSAVVYNKKYLDNLTDMEILERYDKIMEAVDYQINEGGKYVEKLEDYKSKIDGLLVSIIDVDCDFVKTNLAPKFKENPTDLKLAKKIFAFMLNGKCTDDPLWLEAGQVIQEKEPNYGLAKNLGIKFKDTDKAKAEKYFNMALSLTEDPSQKSDMYIQLGSLRSGGAALELYQKALSVDPNNKDAYNAMGYAISQSYNSCKKGKDPVEDRGVFLLAYDFFSQAGNSRMMNSMKEQFPSTEEIFTFNHEKGQKITVDCWGRSTTIRSRD
ncbi:tetratricopeptide repeat protein [Fulvivirga maritima]|uniref:tetratricopeptide repeat protein n=1 Tax=Fulvivirga maritima TaxID=2904247 RepID=UPI001F2731C2|nr:tetratricopeptide repeat protein [Fulvivirga maritima]UII28673.1 tetratricopeptide repeat protein [Fulvivirga maritima]